MNAVELEVALGVDGYDKPEDYLRLEVWVLLCKRGVYQQRRLRMSRRKLEMPT